MAQTEHVGLTALEAERDKLLQEYDAALLQAADDPVRTEHGVSCEAHFRTFLQQFLPRKYGVTKGYIITPDLNYAGPLEEWDIIIYDAMESPVLFVRQNRDEHEQSGKRGIPVEYVRGIVELKATFNKPMVTKVTNKLLKLRQFRKKEGTERKYGDPNLPFDFRAFAVFFESKVKNSKEYSDALGALSPIWGPDPLLNFSGGLIMRGHTCPHYSATISYLMGAMPDLREWLLPCCESSELFPAHIEDLKVTVVSRGFGPNQFWSYMIDMVHALNGHDYDLPFMGPTNLTGGYGRRSGTSGRVRLYATLRLFPVEAAT